MLLLLSACGDRPVFGPPTHPDTGIVDANLQDGSLRDAGRDSGIDAAIDAGHDAATIDAALPDTGIDAATHDAGMDAAVVILIDGGLPDTGIVLLDGGHDAAVGDAGRDAGHDGGSDAGNDGGSDAGNDGGSDAGNDGGSDAGNDGGSDAAISDANTHFGPAPVLLGSTTDLASPAAYVLLSQTGVTNVIGSMISGGNVGVSPAASTSITGFALIIDSTGQFSSSVSVVPPGHVYAADYVSPTPGNLTAAILAMQGAYADAAGRTGPDFTDLLIGHIGGSILVPGLYRWASTVDMTISTTLTGGANDVWIFQVQNDLELSGAASILLTGGAQARNVFWQVAGQTTIGTDAHFEGNILCATGITLQTGASLHGSAYAQTLIALDNNNIVAP